MIIKIKHLQFIFCLAYTLCLNSQNFERFSNKQGFNQNTINAIEQDKYGFLWYATPNGLIRYDGYDFETFATKAYIYASLVTILPHFLMIIMVYFGYFVQKKMFMYLV